MDCATRPHEDIDGYMRHASHLSILRSIVCLIQPQVHKNGVGRGRGGEARTNQIAPQTARGAPQLSAHKPSILQPCLLSILFICSCTVRARQQRNVLKTIELDCVSFTPCHPTRQPLSLERLRAQFSNGQGRHSLLAALMDDVFQVTSTLLGFKLNSTSSTLGFVSFSDMLSNFHLPYQLRQGLPASL